MAIRSKPQPKKAIRDSRAALRKPAQPKLTGRKFSKQPSLGTAQVTPQPQRIQAKVNAASFNTRYVPRSQPKPYIHVDKPFNWKLARLWTRVMQMIWVGRLMKSLVWLRRALFILQTHQMFGGKLAA